MIEKLNCFSKYLNDYFYIVNNVAKNNFNYHKTDFEELTINDMLNGIPQDTYLAAKINNNEKENTITLELLQNEYSIFRGEFALRTDIEMKFTQALRTVKSLLQSDNINISYQKITEHIIRDNYSQNGKSRTVFVQVYEVSFN